MKSEKVPYVNVVQFKEWWGKRRRYESTIPKLGYYTKDDGNIPTDTEVIL